MNVAILYQTKEPPRVDNIRKPMKKGSYSDSGADIANGYNVILPAENPQEEHDYDRVLALAHM